MLIADEALIDDIYRMNYITLSLAKFPDFDSNEFPNLDTDVIVIKADTGEHAAYYCIGQDYSYAGLVRFALRLAPFMTVAAETLDTLNGQCLRRSQESAWGENQLQEATLGLNPNRAMHKIDIECDIDCLWSTLDLTAAISSTNQPVSPATTVTLADGRSTSITGLGLYTNVSQSVLDNLMALGLWDSLVSNGFLQPIKLPSSLCALTGTSFISSVVCNALEVNINDIVYGSGDPASAPNMTPYSRGQSVRFHVTSLSSGDSVSRDVYQLGGGMDETVKMIVTCVPFANAGIYCGFKYDKLSFNDNHEYGACSSNGLPTNTLVTKVSSQAAYRAAAYLQQQLQIDNNSQVADTQFKAQMSSLDLSMASNTINALAGIGGSFAAGNPIGIVANGANGLLGNAQTANTRALKDEMFALNANARDIQRASAGISYQAAQAVSPSVIALPAAAAAAFSTVSFLVLKEAPSSRETQTIQNFVSAYGELTYDYITGTDFKDWLNSIVGYAYIQMATITSLTVDSADVDYNVPLTYFLKIALIDTLTKGVGFVA